MHHAPPSQMFLDFLFSKTSKDSLQNLKDTQKALLHLVIIIQGVWDKVVSFDIEMFRKQPKLQNNKHCFKITDFLQRPTGLSIAKQDRRQSHVRKKKQNKTWRCRLMTLIGVS